MQLFYDVMGTATFAMTSSFAALSPTGVVPKVVYRFAAISTVAWSYSTDSGTTQVDVPANTLHTIELYQPFTSPTSALKVKTATTGTLQLAVYGSNAG